MDKDNHPLLSLNKMLEIETWNSTGTMLLLKETPSLGSTDTRLKSMETSEASTTDSTLMKDSLTNNSLPEKSLLNQDPNILTLPLTLKCSSTTLPEMETKPLFHSSYKWIMIWKDPTNSSILCNLTFGALILTSNSNLTNPSTLTTLLKVVLDNTLINPFTCTLDLTQFPPVRKVCSDLCLRTLSN